LKIFHMSTVAIGKLGSPHVGTRRRGRAAWGPGLTNAVGVPVAPRLPVCSRISPVVATVVLVTVLRVVPVRVGIVLITSRSPAVAAVITLRGVGVAVVVVVPVVSGVVGLRSGVVTWMRWVGHRRTPVRGMVAAGTVPCLPAIASAVGLVVALILLVRLLILLLLLLLLLLLATAVLL